MKTSVSSKISWSRLRIVVNASGSEISSASVHACTRIVQDMSWLKERVRIGRESDGDFEPKRERMGKMQLKSEWL